MTELFSDTTTRAVEYALIAVAQRQATTANNIANVNTPGFKSGRVKFEDQLAEALRSGTPLEDLSIRRVAANTPINGRGNDVALEEESRDLITAGVQYEALVNALNHKFNVLRSAIGGR